MGLLKIAVSLILFKVRLKVKKSIIMWRILSIILSLYSVMIIAIIPGVVTSYYIESIKIKTNESMEKFLYDLERLPALSKEELSDISEKVKKVHNEKKEYILKE